MAESMFRTQSLENLSSPEQLDRTLKVTSPRSWLLLSSFGLVLVGVVVWSFTGKIPENAAARGMLIREGGINPVISLQGGILKKMLIKPGDMIRVGTPIAILSTPTGERKIINTPIGGTVVETLISEGAVVSPYTAIATAEYQNRPLQAVVFVPQQKAKFIKPGMPVKLQLTNVRKEEYGLLKGTVSDIGDYPISSTALKAVLSNDLLESTFLQMGAIVKVEVELNEDETTLTRYQWTTKQGPPFDITSGTEVSLAQIELNSQRPIELALPIKIDRKEVAYK